MTFHRQVMLAQGLSSRFSMYIQNPTPTCVSAFIFLRHQSQVGQMVGALFIWIADWQGRRLPIFLGCLGVCIATAVTALAPTLSVFIGGRFLLSFFAIIACTAAPLYIIEVAPPQYRATVAGMYNTFYYVVRGFIPFVYSLYPE